MKLGIMQPYFFPYPGYFSLIKATNKFILFDISQYVRHSWMNRNRIIDPNSNGCRYITVPVKKHKFKSPINSLAIHNGENWKEKIIAYLGYYRKYAPHYKKVVEFLHETLKDEFDSLSELNVHTLKASCAYIGIDQNFEVFSEMKINVEPVGNADEWGLNICNALGINEYINPVGGQSFMDKQKYLKNNIDLKFLEFGYKPYNQKRDEFIPGLSIIDAMMFNSPAEINQMLDDYKLVS